MKKAIKTTLAIVCMAALLTTATPTQAATKTELDFTEATISLGKKGYHDMSGEGKGISGSDIHQIKILNVKKGVKYTCTSSNKKVVTATVKNNKIQLTGIKEGKATITCKQTVNKKITTIGKIKVTVKNAEIGTYEKIPLNNHVHTEEDDFYEGILYIQYYSTDPQVKYKISSNNKKLFKVSEANIPGGLNYEIKESGTYTLTLKQTYKKKTVTKKIKINCVDAEVKDEVTLIAGENSNWRVLADYIANNKQYYFESEDGVDLSKKTEDSILYINFDDDSYYNLYALKAGTVKINMYYYDEEAKTKGKFLGSCVVTVKEYHTEELNFSEYTLRKGMTYIGECTMEEPNLIQFDIEPYESRDPVEVVSSDESILKVFSKEEDGYTEWYYVPVGAGTVTLTATSNGVSGTKTVTVYATEDEYDKAYQEDDSLDDYWF